MTDSTTGPTSDTMHEPNDAALRATAIEAGYGETRILGDIDLDVLRGRVTVLVGPNGCGKSTLLRVCSRLLEPSDGSVVIDGDDVATLSTRALAQRMAVLPQAPNTPPHFTVRELVEQGRYAHVGPFGMLRTQDDAAIDRAIELSGMQRYEHRDVDTLSGGERQRAWFALALAQDTPLLVLDEPTTHLDVGAQWEVLELVQQLNREHGVTVLAVLHELNHAATIADHLVVLRSGSVVRAGAPWDALDEALLADVFGLDATIIPDPRSGAPVILQHGTASAAAAVTESTTGTELTTELATETDRNDPS
ncbi:MAG: ABC transporter ATP-binding protein [Actinomycetota bacterium]